VGRAINYPVGSVVVVTFPFSDLKGQKLRPALVIAHVEFDDLILCQITSKAYTSKTAIRLTPSDFQEGKLPITSYIRPDKLFTCDPKIIKQAAGKLTGTKRKSVLKQVREIFASTQ
jgi:mRNA interferase MazF